MFLSILIKLISSILIFSTQLFLVRGITMSLILNSLTLFPILITFATHSAPIGDGSFEGKLAYFPSTKSKSAGLMGRKEP